MQATIFYFLLILSSIVQTERTECNIMTIAPELYHRMFPDTVQNPDDRIPAEHIPNTTCTFKYTQTKLTLTIGTMTNIDSNCNYSCDSFPLNTTDYGFGPEHTKTKNMAIQNTGIAIFERGVFSTWYNIEILQINMNYNLTRIEPGAFENMTNVWNLTISDNPLLGALEHDTFNGLVNLRGLRYLRNNVKQLDLITIALSPSVLPYLTYIDFTGNNITKIERNDFEPMKNSQLDSLIISLTKTEWIHSEAFDPLTKLISLTISRNNLNTSTLKSLLDHLRTSLPGLTHISLAENALNVNPRPLLEVVTRETLLMDLQHNHFGVLNSETFPYMPNVKYLDLTDVMIDDLPQGVINITKMPQLIHLYLGGNIFSGLKPYMVPASLVRLDISNNENDLPWNTQFQIDGDVFAKMPDLELLNLSGNRINGLLRSMLKNTGSLRILLLRNAYITQIEDKAFESSTKLFYLDLSTNIFPMVNPLKKEIFKGLGELLALDLSDCSISHINNNVFFYLNKLQYLSLRQNLLQTLSEINFNNLKYLRILDLRYNILVSWQTRLFNKNICLHRTKFDYNHIQTINENMLYDFMMARKVSLYGNSIQCDCNLYRAVYKVKDKWNQSDVSIEDDMNTCANKNVSILDFLKMKQCDEQSDLTVVIGVTIFLLFCIILCSIVVYYYYKYDIHFWFLRIKRKLGLLHYMGNSKNFEKPEDFKYDAFVSYSIEDEKFVQKLVYILETDCSRFKLCVFERDFTVGDVLTERILECMECSRRTILVLTESFARSQWCCWEMCIAQSRSISLNNSEHKDPLILIKKSHIPNSLMTQTLRYLMKTRVYLEWHDSPTRQRIFWELLKDSLKPRKLVTT